MHIQIIPFVIVFVKKAIYGNIKNWSQCQHAYMVILIKCQILPIDFERNMWQSVMRIERLKRLKFLSVMSKVLISNHVLHLFFCVPAVNGCQKIRTTSGKQCFVLHQFIHSNVHKWLQFALEIILCWNLQPSGRFEKVNSKWRIFTFVIFTACICLHF